MINLYYWLYSLFPKPVPWLVTATEDTLYPFCSLWRPFKHRENNDKYQFHNISYHCIISRVASQKLTMSFWNTIQIFKNLKPSKVYQTSINSLEIPEPDIRQKRRFGRKKGEAELYQTLFKDNKYNKWIRAARISHFVT